MEGTVFGDLCVVPENYLGQISADGMTADLLHLTKMGH